MGNNTSGQEANRLNFLSEFEEYVIKEKGTEVAWTGKYNDLKDAGTFICKQCGQALFRSEDKFDSRCGWPSFDDEIEGAVKRVPDADGMRTEIVCSNCGAHLGHVFEGEGFTDKNLRHCVNSVSMDFVAGDLDEGRYETAILAGGCFWGVEYYLQKMDGVKSVVSGYTGGKIKNPSYREVSTGRTGHAEAVKVVYDPDKVSYEEVLRTFLEIHDPTQVNRQGPDIGEQYRSAIFFMNDYQREIAVKLLNILRDKGYDIATEMTRAGEFYEAEQYHQDYYFEKGSTPYCHGYVKRF
ncbi:MAG: bifunctional methionine sulfoxide reductase B/A protein [Bacteroidales bacterium]|jgi:peptide methionine sulfoxide reductase msrA/msrB|nr:bifunctional methionine sulfoxide reductase B/A protein [Bacteroidales bacterium]